MSDRSFVLHPFPLTGQPQPNLQIAGQIARQGNCLQIRYTLLGNLTQVVMATPSNAPIRQHNLWESTCFEFFLGLSGHDRYWEFNLSPTGDWNVYRFEGYRQGMQEERAFTALPFCLQSDADRFTLALDVDLDGIISVQQALEVAITAVIAAPDHSVTYWALTHCGTEADFHRRDSFTIAL